MQKIIIYYLISFLRFLFTSLSFLNCSCITCTMVIRNKFSQSKYTLTNLFLKILIPYINLLTEYTRKIGKILPYVNYIKAHKNLCSVYDVTKFQAMPKTKILSQTKGIDNCFRDCLILYLIAQLETLKCNE